MLDSAKIKEELLRLIPSLRSSCKLEQIHKGYSSDTKYIVYASNGNPLYILRTYNKDQETNKKLEYNRLQLMEQHGVMCSRPIEIGALPELNLGYMIVSYLEGNEATDELQDLSEEEQLRVGIQCGIELRKINQINCPDPMGPWDVRMLAKHQRYREEYAKCGVRINNDKTLLAFIDNHLHLMRDRPNMFQHDDFHIGNLILKDGRLSGIIDFNRYDWGDPIHEFVKVGMFSSEVSIPFSIGQIRGYHHHTEPNDAFWQLYSLYLAMTLISSIVWILKVKADELDEMLMKVNRVMKEHDDFGEYVPTWYRSYKSDIV